MQQYWEEQCDVGPQKSLLSITTQIINCLWITRDFSSVRPIVGKKLRNTNSLHHPHAKRTAQDMIFTFLVNGLLNLLLGISRCTNLTSLNNQRNNACNRLVVTFLYEDLSPFYALHNWIEKILVDKLVRHV